MSRVLIVFADPALGARLAAELTDAGHDVRAVTSGERAMDRFIQEPSDVVVIDFDLEGRDGITTAEAIRWMPGGRRARVVLTAAAEPEDGPLADLAESVDAFATLVGSREELSGVVARAASVEPHTAETRVLSTEHVLLEAERRRSSSFPSEPEPLTPREDPTPLTRALEAPSPIAEDVEDSTLDEPTPDSWQWRDTDGRIEGREVRELAEEDTQGDLVGTFDQLSFARVLHRMAEKRATGALICVHPPDLRETTEGTEPTKVVYFRAGVPVHVRSNVVGECLGQVLTRMRKIGPVALKESLKAMRRGEGRQGEVLVEMGAIEPLELSEALAQQMRLKLFELFAWRRGTFRFTAERQPPPDLIDLELGLAEIAYRGLTATRDPREILELLEEHGHRFVIPEARKMVRFLALAEERGLRAVIRRADGSRTVSEVLAGSSDPGHAAILLHAMECLDAVTLAEEPLRTRAKPAASLPSVPSAVATLPSSSGVPAPISLASVSIPSGDALAPSAEAPIADDLADPTDADRDRTSVAYVPSVPSSRVEAETVLASAESLGLPVEEPAPPSEPSAPPSEPPAQLPAPEPPPSRAELTLASSSSSVELPDPPERDAAGSGLRAKPDGELDERVERLLKAERRFRRGQRAVEKASFAQAVKAFEEAVELCPDEGHFLVHLAYARYAAAPGDAGLLARCIAEAQRGCAIAPPMALEHVLLARLLSAADRDPEARRAYSRALEIEPDHDEARRELEALVR
ncbi:MAG: DUF4388 domain-containing protein [Sandaracinaceae bacterium]|nr:DUF4388 domain-containing protein [Sandaracinaceae bacterium]